MEIRHLRYFVAIAEERSFTRAAERLWVAQPGLSKQIRRLEAELGVRLFDRHTRGVDLTEAGKLFLERARAALSAADVAAATGRDLGAGVVGTVRLGLSTGVRWQRTAAVLEQFTRDHSNIELTVLEGHGGTLWHDLRDGRLDVMIAPSVFSSVDLRTFALGTEPWFVLVGTNHRLAGQGPLNVRDLDGERIAVSAHRDGAGYDRVVAETLCEFGITPELVRAAPGPALHTELADGNVLALTTAPDALHDQVLARPLYPLRTLPFELMCRDETLSPALTQFIRVASECVARKRAARPALVAVS